MVNDYPALTVCASSLVLDCGCSQSTARFISDPQVISNLGEHYKQLCKMGLVTQRMPMRGRAKSQGQIIEVIEWKVRRQIRVGRLVGQYQKRAVKEIVTRASGELAHIATIMDMFIGCSLPPCGVCWLVPPP